MSEPAQIASVKDAKPESFVEDRLTLAYRKLSYFWSTLLLIFALVVTYWDIAKVLLAWALYLTISGFI